MRLGEFLGSFRFSLGVMESRKKIKGEARTFGKKHRMEALAKCGDQPKIDLMSSSKQEQFASFFGWVGAIGGGLWCYSDTNDIGVAIVVALIGGAVGYFIGKLLWLAIVLSLILVGFVVRQVFFSSVRQAVRKEVVSKPPPPPPSSSPSRTISPPPNTTNYTEYLGVTLKNDCSEKIFVAINYQDDNDDWMTSGWWTVEPYSTKVTNVKTQNPHLYFYANSSEGKEWTGEEDSESVTKKVTSEKFDSKNNSGVYSWDDNYREEKFFHRESSTSSGTYTQSFSCDETKEYLNVSLKNSCSEKIYVAINYQDDNEDWITSGWWTVEPYSTTETNVKTQNKVLYFYANSSTGMEWTGTDEAKSVTKKVTSKRFNSKNNTGVYSWQDNYREESFFRRESSRSSGTYTQSFSCSD
ncbi:DUF1036 domain-containing protein [Spongiimicrobium salis]|uniref:DUF1036 domain-containing protein n=1 Tax=Spongiimicrobium salis TaxID=1667022 RepID=UPI00374CA386